MRRMDAFLIPGGFGTRQESTTAGCTCSSARCRRRAAHQRVHRLVDLREMGLLDGMPATNRKEPDRVEPSAWARCRSSAWPRSRRSAESPARGSSMPAASSPRGGIASGMEMGFHLLRRAGYDEAFIADVARVMEYKAGYDLYRDDIEYHGLTVRAEFVAAQGRNERRVCDAALRLVRPAGCEAAL